MNQVFRLSLGIFLSWAYVSYAGVSIQINQEAYSAQPIGVVPFKWGGSGAPPQDIAGIIAADLRNSGKFKPLDKSHLPQYPTTASEVTPLAWSGIGINAVVVGKIWPSADDSYVLSYQLVDTFHNPGIVLSENQFKVSGKWLRYATHGVSDETFEKLIGIQGAFRTRIAYVVHTSSSMYPYELRVSDYDGWNQIPVHRSPRLLMSPAWSPDASKLAYVTFESGHSALVIQTLDSTAIRQVASFPQHNGAPAFSPDGSKLAFVLSKTGSLNLYIMDLLSNQISALTDSRSNNTEPTWFPDSQTLAYTSDQGGSPQIYKININVGVPQRLSWTGTHNQNANVSADGKFLVMVSRNNSIQHIAKLNLITGTVQVLTDTFMDDTPSIAPNGSMIIYSATQKGTTCILHLVSANGDFKAHFPVIHESVKFPAWSPYL
ncbi:Tol-Pal system beta propeller repeat protein TolB [Candidatus Steffania adelgidicola]|uniref:Tol-Pal system beta propeller repeat protein TolB n=1 Tax=Candidatus Steffania adelgidicola TaxID=1076626 RepID=UPI001D00AE6A|nr:Tol-Pal system beta propeller repeat protein TolB [Candidatus Steffania adelgidicola]UDG79747.1 Protein TolB [Candidatus Steffania adelgidicola]